MFGVVGYKVYVKTLSNIYAVISLIVANLIPLFGVMFYGWNVFSLMLLYWLENVIIGFFTILKMKKAEGSLLNKFPMSLKVNGRDVSSFKRQSMFDERAFFIPFFTLHFGLFTFVQGIFVLVFFFSSQVTFAGVIIGFLSLCFSHFMSYQLNYLDREEYKTTSVEYLFISPYPRIVVMQLTVILGGMFALSNQTIYAGILLVVLKTIADLVTHLIEHGRVTRTNVPITSTI